MGLVIRCMDCNTDCGLSGERNHHNFREEAVPTTEITGLPELFFYCGRVEMNCVGYISENAGEIIFQ